MSPSFAHEKRDYSEVKSETHRYHQVKKMETQEFTRLIGMADIHCPELSKVLGTGMTFLKVGGAAGAVGPHPTMRIVRTAVTISTILPSHP